MLKDRTDLLITPQEMQILSNIATDQATGNHLIRPRSREYWKMRAEVGEAFDANPPTPRHAQMLEYIKQCSDYSYWLSLPDEKKLFLETDESDPDPKH